MTIAEPINTIISREHCVKHEILKVGQVLSGEEVCFVHTSMMAQIWGITSDLVPLPQLVFLLYFPLIFVYH